MASLSVSCKHSLFLDALHSQNTGRPPVWIMRQAGRYLPEYRALREKRRFKEMIRCPEIAAQVTLMPIKRYQMDAAIIFSDILTIPEALGCQFDFHEGVGPVFESPVTPKDVDKLSFDHSLSYVSDAIKLVKPELEVPLIGFCGGPFTVVSYMTGGIKPAKKWLFNDPESFHKLLGIITDASIDYLKMQISAGIDAFQIFESWASFLAYPELQEFSFPYLQKIIKASSIPVIFFSKGTSGFLQDLIQLKANALSLDWNSDLAKIRQKTPQSIALQGNLDPHVLYGSSKVIQKQCRILLDKMRGDKGFIFNLGHGILPDISPDAVQVLVDTVKNAV